MTVEPSHITELRAAVQVGAERADIRSQAHVDTIRTRHAAATAGPWHAVDLRRQQGGQIRLFAKGASNIIGNVLRSGPNPGADGDMLGHAHQDIEFLLAEVDRLRAARDTVFKLVSELVDPDDCEFDHHGGCQAHGFLSLEPGDSCPHQDAKDLIDAYGIK